MTGILRILGRSAAILGGYTAACVAATFLIALAFWLPHPDGLQVFSPIMLPRIAFLALLVANASLAPALVAIAIGEFTARQGWLYYALAGGAAALAFIIGFDLTAGDHGAFAMVLLAAGMAAGCVYWLIAGRGAGRWLSAFRQQDARGKD